ncbi:hypothetical protein CPB84DRAFT_1747563 [Gymnopilus junonius]|uniref:Uncharacterized protein n=1 Tax=Gymnopilus junonius TaxID=109634 RepID=A0A9P5NNY4_GYMJU|nr:hypothetical protein CPB84DRAFT_1747563 [Gymnopilus junonius]
MRSSVVLTPLTQSIKVIKSKGTSNFDGYCTSRHPPKVSKPHVLKMHILRDCKHIPDDVRKKIEHELGTYDSRKAPSIMLTSSFSEVIPSEGPKRQSGEQVDFECDVSYTDYRRKRSEFAFDKTELEDVAQMCSEPNLPLDLVFLWTRIDTQKDNDALTGHNSMKLAIRILSVIANSAAVSVI